MTAKEMGAGARKLTGPYFVRPLPRRIRGRRVQGHIRNNGETPGARVVRVVPQLETQRGLHTAGKVVSARSRVARSSCVLLPFPSRSRAAVQAMLGEQQIYGFLSESLRRGVGIERKLP
jgi:hypothetical protein